MPHDDLRRRCEHLVAALPIPSPFDLDTFVRALEDERGRPIHLMPTTTPMEGLCGIWWQTRRADYVFFEANTSLVHRQHIVCHEIGHLVSRHEAGTAISDRVARTLLPDLDPAEVREVLGRSGYTDREEREAETIARMIVWTAARRASRGGAVPGTAAEFAERIERIERSLTGRRGKAR